MIFVTVGTHEQSFNRLIECIDDIKKRNVIKDEIIIQTGYCSYHPAYCTCQQFFTRIEMTKLMSQARIIITHGGPSSFLEPIQIGKIPIVFPRQKRYGEHINDHQLLFCRAFKERMNNIILAEETSDLEYCILNYPVLANECSGNLENNNRNFNIKFEKLISDLMNEKR